ncbi:uncharacterized protein LOC109541256 isoform X2 [Dendroctonus ponderosae]|uniref:uncharacterized protein LOC109541256 isoform X2 n=1 Tax=Dendroctonus ponderosae TaxID=77166 RepID=UPI002035A4DC|nr:uncharacterized protein LOC109541256 isoform X2 [Dendroctonus ponderosae]
MDMAPLPDNNKTTLQTQQNKGKPQKAKEQPHDVKNTSEELGGESQNPIDKPQNVKEDFQQDQGKFQSTKDQFQVFGTGSQYSVGKSINPKDKTQCVKDQCQDSEGESQDASDQYQDAKDQFDDSEADPEDNKVRTQCFEAKFHNSACNSYDPIGKPHAAKGECQESDGTYPDGQDGLGSDNFRSGKLEDSHDDLQDYRFQSQGAKITVQSCKDLCSQSSVDKTSIVKDDSEGDLQDVNEQFEDSEAEPYDDKIQFQDREAKSHAADDNSQTPIGTTQDVKDELKASSESQCVQDQPVFNIRRVTEVGKSEDEPQDYNLRCIGSKVKSQNFEIPQSCTDRPHQSKLDVKDLDGGSYDVMPKLEESDLRDQYPSSDSKFQSSQNDPQDPIGKFLYDTNQPQSSASESLEPLIKLEDSENRHQDCNMQSVGSKVKFQHSFGTLRNCTGQVQDAQNKSNDSKGTSQDAKGEFEQSVDEWQATKGRQPQFWNCSSPSENQSKNFTDQCHAVEVIPQQSEGYLSFKDIDHDVIDIYQEDKITASEEKSLTANRQTFATNFEYLDDKRQNVIDQLQDSELHDGAEQFGDSAVSCENEAQDAAAGYQDVADNTQTIKEQSERAKQKYGLNYGDCREEKEIIVTHLNDKELKSLLDEAMSYKNPSDRQGKSELFNELLQIAERDELDRRAAAASGPKIVRHHNLKALEKRKATNSHVNSHGGSLDNLSNKENFERPGSKSGTGNNPEDSVSARTKGGGSLPNDMNGSETREFIGEAVKQQKMNELALIPSSPEEIPQDDLSARDYEERLIDEGECSQEVGLSPAENLLISTATKYTTQATIHIQSHRASNVDDPLALTGLDGSAVERKPVDSSMLGKVIQHNKGLINLKTTNIEERFIFFQKVDENGNALQQKEKKKKKQTDKNVVLMKSEHIQGHRSEIIDDVDELLHYIEGTTDNMKSRTIQSKSKQVHKQHPPDDAGSRVGKKKQFKSVSKDSDNNLEAESRHELKKSNSLVEISGMKSDREFERFTNNKNKQEKDKENVALRGNKPTIDRSRERRSWGDVEPSSFQTLYNASSLEHLETSADNWEVTRPKKKSKKRRNSLSSASGARQNSSASGVSSTRSNEDRRSRRAPSPDLGVVRVGVSNAKITRSMPHSEKSNDSSSDVDSVRSLPLDGPISYADIAKNIEKKKPSPEKQERAVLINKDKNSQSQKSVEADLRNSSSSYVPPQVSVPVEKSPAAPIKDSLSRSNSITKTTVPDVHNIKSFPAITESATKMSNIPVTTIANPQPQSITTCDKAVQSNLSYDDSFVREVPPSSLQKTTSMQNLQTELHSSAVQCVKTHASSTIKRHNPHNSATKDRRSKGMARDNSVSQPVVHGDDYNELPLLKDPTHYISQRMPPDIMDVSTIEKLQLLNYSDSGTASKSSNSSFHKSTQVSYTPTITTVTVAASNAASTLSENTTHQGTSKGKRKKGGGNNNNNNNNATLKTSGGEIRNVVSETVPVVSSVCDTSSERKEISSNIINGVSENQKHMPSEVHVSDETRASLSSGNTPPVVILSGLSKEVPSGLVFGFDINEQLLLEDSGDNINATLPQQGMPNSTAVVSEPNLSENNITNINVRRFPNRGDEWDKMYRPHPSEKHPPKHNHDKIVNFVAMAWESVLSQQIVYYSDSL